MNQKEKEKSICLHERKTTIKFNNSNQFHSEIMLHTRISGNSQQIF